MPKLPPRPAVRPAGPAGPHFIVEIEWDTMHAKTRETVAGIVDGYVTCSGPPRRFGLRPDAEAFATQVRGLLKTQATMYFEVFVVLEVRT